MNNKAKLENILEISSVQKMKLDKEENRVIDQARPHTGSGPNAHNSIGCNNMSFDFPRYTPRFPFYHIGKLYHPPKPMYHIKHLKVCHFEYFEQFAINDLHFLSCKNNNNNINKNNNNNNNNDNKKNIRVDRCGTDRLIRNDAKERRS